MFMSINKLITVVSVLMPAHNAQATLQAAIASVQAQTFTQWELVVVDDGSTDDTPLIVQRMAAQDDRIRLVQPGKQSGLGQVRNVGVAHAQTELLNFLDSDDELLPDALERLYGHMQAHPDCTLVYGQFGMITETGEPYPTQSPDVFWDGQAFAVKTPLPPHNWFDVLTARSLNNVQGVLVRKSAVLTGGLFPEQPGLWCPDYVFFVQQYLHNFAGVHALPHVVFKYRQMTQSLTYGDRGKLKTRTLTVQTAMNVIYDRPNLPATVLTLRSRITVEQYVHRLRSACRMGNLGAMADVLQVARHDASLSFPHWVLLCAKALAMLVKFKLKAEFGRMPA
jgi:glycosyltransferase involved in cell wall biosynthesis